MTAATVCSECGVALKPNPRRAGTRCKPCTARAMARSPEKLAKCSAAMKRRFAEPGYHHEHVRRVTAGTREAMKRPEFLAMRREMGRQVGLLHRGISSTSAGSPERMAAGRKRTQTVLGWCPLEYRAEYMRLVRGKLIRAAEARKIIEQQIAADLDRYLATGQLQQSSREPHLIEGTAL